MERRHNYLYKAFFCEENIWHFLNTQQLNEAQEYSAVFITNARRQVALARQSMGDENGVVVWDYHVIAISHSPTPMVWDFDTSLPFPCPARQWLSGTFGPFSAAPQRYQPIFRLATASRFLSSFNSDRRHMRGPGGQWLQPPPDWPLIGQGHNLDTWLDVSDDRFGVPCDQTELMAQLSSTG